MGLSFVIVISIVGIAVVLGLVVKDDMTKGKNSKDAILEQLDKLIDSYKRRERNEIGK